jgi:hypothetical protein
MAAKNSEDSKEILKSALKTSKYPISQFEDVYKDTQDIIWQKPVLNRVSFGIDSSSSIKMQESILTMASIEPEYNKDKL